MILTCAAAIALLATPPRVGVIAVGEDAASAGELQRTIELRLSASPKVQLAPASDLSAALPPAPARAARPAVDAAIAKEAATLLQAATDAYYEDRAADALGKLGELAALQERTQAFPVSERVRLLLWRTAVFLALKDGAQAEAEALAALSLNPDVKVDLNEFKPSVKDAVDRVRTRGFRLVTVVVSGLPPGSTLELDDRAVTAPFKVSVGRHRLSARAPGRRDVVRTFDAAGDLSVPMYLPLATDAATDAALAALASSENPSREQRSVADGLLAKAKLDWLIVAIAPPGAEPRAVALAATGAQHASGAMTAGNLAAWTDQRVTSTSSATVAATPRPARTPRPPGPPPAAGKASTVAILADGGVAWTTRTRTLQGKSGRPFETSFAGVGPRVAVDVSRGSPFAHAEAAWTTYGISTLDVTLPDGSGTQVTGGTTAQGRLLAGWRHAFGDREASPSVFAALGGSFETHAAKDVRDPATGDLGLLTGYSRTAVELALGARYPIAAPGSLRPSVHAALAVAPVSTWTEDPAGASGAKPATAPSFAWNLGVALSPVERLVVALDYSGAARSVAFDGAAQAPADPAIEDATITESFHSVGITAGYRF